MNTVQFICLILWVASFIAWLVCLYRHIVKKEAVEPLLIANIFMLMFTVLYGICSK